MRGATLALMASVVLAGCGRAAPPPESAAPAAAAGQRVCSNCPATATASGWTLAVSTSASGLEVVATPPVGRRVAGYCGGSALTVTVRDASGGVVPSAPRMYAQYCETGDAATGSDTIDVPAKSGSYTVSGHLRLADGSIADIPASVSLSIT